MVEHHTAHQLVKLPDLVTESADSPPHNGLLVLLPGSNEFVDEIE